MGKAIAVLTAGTGTTVVSVGSFYLLGENGTGSGETKGTSSGPSVESVPASSTQTQKQPRTAPTLSFDDLQSFKDSSVASVECIKTFSGLADLKGTSANEISSSGNKIDGNFINTSEVTPASTGCLIVNWDKKEYTGDKWNGTFKLLWTFEKGDKGFISFVVAKEKEAKKLDLTGIFYALSKTDSAWSVANKKEVSTEHEIVKDNKDPKKHFPKIGTALTDLSNKSWWKMFSNKNDLDNVCVSDGTSCQTPTKTKTFKGYWEWTGSSTSTNKLDGWTGNLNDWWNNLYSNDEIAIPTIAAAEKGDWKKVDISETPST